MLRDLGLISDPDDGWPGIHQSYEPLGLLALMEAGLAAHDGVAEDGELQSAYDQGYREGAEDAIARAARRVLGCET